MSACVVKQQNFLETLDIAIPVVRILTWVDNCIFNVDIDRFIYQR